MFDACESFKGSQENCPGGSGHGECATEGFAGGRCAEGCEPSGRLSGLLHHAFFHAHKEVMVEIFKEKIRKTWGQKLDKAADAVVENAQAFFQSMMAKGQAKERLREQLQSIFLEGHK